MELYKLAVANPAWTAPQLAAQLDFGCRRFDDAVRVLTRFQLLRPACDTVRDWDAVSPQSALAELVADEEVELSLREAALDRLKGQVMTLLPSYFEARRRAHRDEAVDVVHDLPAVRRLLAYRTRSAVQEVSSACSGPLCETDLCESLERDSAVLRRGVTVRTLLRHSTRHHQLTREYAVTLAPLGAQIRTVPVVPRSLILVDRELALIPFEGAGGGGAVLVREPAICDYLFQQFEAQWAIGRAFPAEGADDHEESRDDLWQTILCQLARGDKDELIARRLGISVRTCRRHIAAIMESLGAGSRFQAGVLAQQRGVLDSSPLGS